MLKIRKDGVEKIVTSGAFEDLYKGLGYEIVPETSAKKVEEPVKAPQPEVEVKEEKTEKPKTEFKKSK